MARGRGSGFQNANQRQCVEVPAFLGEGHEDQTEESEYQDPTKGVFKGKSEVVDHRYQLWVVGGEGAVNAQGGKK